MSGAKSPDILFYMVTGADRKNPLTSI